MKKLLAVVTAAGLLAVALFTSASLDQSSKLIVQGSTDLPSVQFNVVSPATEVDTPEITAPTTDAVSRAHKEAYAERWGIERIGAPEAWHAAAFAPVLIAVLDTGIAADASFADRVIGAIDFTGSGMTDDEHGHGTLMADTIAGIAPNAEFLNVKVADRRGRCDTTAVAGAIRWAADRGAQVINVSLEIAPSSQLEDSVNYAWQKGAVVVAAAGNGGASDLAYPAAYTQSIAVAGTNQSDGLAVLSNHGDWVDIAAPGFKIVGQSPEGGLSYETGTSPAAAHVSGVAALVFGIVADDSGNTFTNDEVRRAIKSSAQPLAITGIGTGLVDAPSAILALAS